MRIAVIGAGAMGSIYGGKLSAEHEVMLIEKRQDVVDQINLNGLMIDEDGRTNVYHPQAVTDSKGQEEVDLMILFVKALFSESALNENRHLIGDKTVLMTLQNGAGHEDLLKKFVPEERVVIGTTEDNGAVLDLGHVRRGGKGVTNIGSIVPGAQDVLLALKAAFDPCGFQVKIHENIQVLIWDKLYTNVSLSALTGVLQTEMGYIAANEYAWSLAEKLIHEACTVASAYDIPVDEEAIKAKVKATSEASPEGRTSIYVDLKAGRRTEVDTISGAVVKAAAKKGISVPSHEFIVAMVHAMEGRNRA